MISQGEAEQAAKQFVDAHFGVSLPPQEAVLVERFKPLRWRVMYHQRDIREAKHGKFAGSIDGAIMVYVDPETGECRFSP